MPKAVQIHIQQPCHEKWQNMTPNEQGRFCSACQKTVVDFSTMNDKELLEYITTIPGYTACGRFSKDQLNRDIKEADKKRRFCWAYIWNIILATFIITEANAQVCPKKKRALVPSTVVKPDTVNMAISTNGYKAQTIDVKDNVIGQHPVLNPLLELRGHVGGVTVFEKTPVKEKISRFVNSCIPASLKKDVIIFPNPIIKGNIALVKLKVPTGDYKLEILSTSGQIMLIQPLYIQSKEQQVELSTQESWNAGSYWLRISSPNTKNVYQSKLLVK